MGKRSLQNQSSDISYELYKELVDELLTPIEPSLDLNVRYELYVSKLVYLENLQEQCFRSVNSGVQSAPPTKSRCKTFSTSDLQTIQDAISATNDFMRETILEALESRLSRVGFQRREL
jgi:hypothetical protein